MRCVLYGALLHDKLESLRLAYGFFFVKLLAVAFSILLVLFTCRSTRSATKQPEQKRISIRNQIIRNVELISFLLHFIIVGFAFASILYIVTAELCSSSI
jgi:hypothetical protein